MYRLLTFLLLFTFAFGSTVYAQETGAADSDTIATSTEEIDETATSTDEDPVRRAQENIDKVRQDVLNQRSRLIDGLQERETERREDVQEKQEERTDALETRQMERVENIEARQEEREGIQEDRLRVATDKAQMFVERTTERFSAVVGRLETLGERIESRIEKFQERGIDTSEAEALVDSAYTSLSEGQETLRIAADSLMTAVTSDTPRENIEAAKALFDEAKEDLRAAHALFVDAVASLKASVEQ